ncbi:glycosyltransferase [uncultured Endozoicomonas sp.]|uniref:glycosyltransferase n=1 Tax=uncultured Endozoicomonas sp. TaxID=432652 RepID=UPI00260E6BBC|nr:glycosyltransferase [uncultured Endozoicomonas sp.]
MSKPLVIAQIVQHLAPGGIETMAIQLQHHAQDDDTVHIISLQGSQSASINAWNKLATLQNIHFLDKSRGLSLKTIVQLKTLLKQLQVDIVHTHHTGPLIYGGIAAKLSQCRHIHTEHDAWHLNHKINRLLVSGCYHLLQPNVVAVSKLIASKVEKLTGYRKPAVIFNGVDTKLFSPGSQTTAREQLSLPKEAMIIGCAARLTAVKSHDLLLNALTELPDSVHAALAGDGEQKEALHNLTNLLGLEKRVHFLGNLDNMPAFYNAIDVFCLTSRNEGLPFSLLEAQACQKAVVVTDAGACREGVNTESGSIIAIDHYEGLVKVLRKHIPLSTPAGTAASARAFIESTFGLTRMINEYRRLYLEAA